MVGQESGISRCGGRGDLTLRVFTAVSRVRVDSDTLELDNAVKCGQRRRGRP